MGRRLPLGRAFADAAAFVPKAWLEAWGGLILFGVVLAAPLFAPAGWNLRAPPAVFGWAAALFVVGLVTEAGLYRLGVSDTAEAARRRGLGLGGLQFGPPELRLMAAALLVLAFLVTVSLALALVLMFVGAVTGVRPWEVGCPEHIQASLSSGDAPTIVSALSVVAAAFVLAQLAVRLSLFRAATIARGKIVSLNALALGEGNLWRLLIGLVASLAPTFALLAISGSKWALTSSNHTAFLILTALVTAAVQLPFSIGFLSSAYKRLEYLPA
jgi:hypothetical protein